MLKNIKTREQFIDENAHLFWYIRKEALHDISDEVLVEFVMNHGDLNAIKMMFTILGINRLNTIYKNLKGRRKLNYYPEVYNFFGLLMKRYA